MKYFLGLFLTILITPLNAASESGFFVLNTWLSPNLQYAKKNPTNELIKDAFKRLNIDLTIDVKPPERSIREDNNGIVDGEFMRIATISEFYPNLLKVPQRIGHLQFVAFSHNKDIDLTNGWSALADYKIGYVTGWKIVEKNIAHFKHSYPVGNAETMFNMLASKRFDVIVYSKNKGLEIIDHKGLTKIKLINPPLSKQAMFLFVHQKHRALIPKINQALIDTSISHKLAGSKITL
ncbi:MAG: transporter substrate-binding domain-containing protein [Gammaproteobacteria bacterium]|nr:transporter substrate-binding domain-containing protein [Gammaproteobacteria bacterium]